MCKIGHYLDLRTNFMNHIGQLSIFYKTRGFTFDNFGKKKWPNSKKRPPLEGSNYYTWYTGVKILSGVVLFCLILSIVSHPLHYSCLF